MMRKLTCALAAAAAIAASVPTLANAGEFGVYVGGDHGYYGDRYDGPRVRLHERDREFRHHYFHRDYGDRDVVIRHHHWDHD
jgi:Ni/Co efflux regulator RcnB